MKKGFYSELYFIINRIVLMNFTHGFCGIKRAGEFTSVFTHPYGPKSFLGFLLPSFPTAVPKVTSCQRNLHWPEIGTCGRSRWPEQELRVRCGTLGFGCVVWISNIKIYIDQYVDIITRMFLCYIIMSNESKWKNRIAVDRCFIDGCALVVISNNQEIWLVSSVIASGMMDLFLTFGIWCLFNGLQQSASEWMLQRFRSVSPTSRK